MGSLRTQRDEVPEHVGILQVSNRVPLLRVDEAREKKRVADEENGSIVPREVPQSLVSVELHCKAARIPSSVCTSTFSTW